MNEKEKSLIGLEVAVYKDGSEFRTSITELGWAWFPRVVANDGSELKSWEKYKLIYANIRDAVVMVEVKNKETKNEQRKN